jgi:hypothetical protein
LFLDEHGRVTQRMPRTLQAMPLDARRCITAIRIPHHRNRNITRRLVNGDELKVEKWEPLSEDDMSNLVLDIEFVRYR